MWFKDILHKGTSFIKDSAKKTGKALKKGSKTTLSKMPDIAGKTSITAKNMVEIDQCIAKKRGLLIFGNEKQETFQKLLLKMPIFMTKAWSGNIAVQIVLVDEFPDLVKNSNINPEEITIVFFAEGKEIERFTHPEDIDYTFSNLNPKLWQSN